MSKKSLEFIGFIGGGRITSIFLEGFRRKGRDLTGVAVSDTDPETLQKLEASFPEIRTCPNDNSAPASKDLVFLALHPPAIAGVLSELKDVIPSTSLLISLAPKWSIQALSNGLGGFNRIVRMIPNAPSVMNKGYNPIAFSNSLTKKGKEELINILGVLGDCPEVEEGKLEAYALLTGAGPTYIWPQLNELRSIGQSFGLTPRETEEALGKMIKGAVKTLFDSGFSYDKVMNLIPMKPLGEGENTICKIYQEKLQELYGKLKS
ncbi:pyrroline-5-carboxylate reductase [Syntrophus gentianae]|uniref:Pyrroline-5-carboxylate reductase n=1 Tax=Syntrophus gentianae TaxID=43775 RepID=A0A1H8A0K3_9BACT|nr:NAD(P)-binding domain-containing protein [Syntrophus gentianae]SEM63077.1 pyrroline-5-carboxylate reductase [Syntrophus gentianae]